MSGSCAARRSGEGTPTPAGRRECSGAGGKVVDKPANGEGADMHDEDGKDRTAPVAKKPWHKPRLTLSDAIILEEVKSGATAWRRGMRMRCITRKAGALPATEERGMSRTLLLVGVQSRKLAGSSRIGGAL